MNTPDFPDAGAPEGTENALAREIARIANELFSGAAPTTPSLPAAAIGSANPGLSAPPHFGPSAAAPGAFGISPAFAFPLVPGSLQQPPLPNAPPPKESDLRTIPALVTEAVGGPAPIELAKTAGADAGAPSDAPYFLALAGLPGGLPSGGAAPALPSTEFYPELAPSITGGAPALDSYGAKAGTPIFDPHAIKLDFPILSERVHGRPLVWLDNAATTQKPRAVIERVSQYYERENSNVHRAAHALAARATDAYEAAREKTRRFLNAGSVNEVVFVRGATEAINLVAKSWGARNVRKGDEIVITWLEHHANIVPWQQLCAEKGACLRVAPVDDRGQVLLDEFDKLLGPRTRIVSMPQVSNALGTIVPVQEMVAMARRRGALTLVDGAQAVSHMPVDVQSIGSDFYVFSGHKIFAPMGIGVLYGKEDLLNTMPPWQGGGNMIDDVTFEKTTYRNAPVRFEAGTGSIGDAVGLGAALDYVTALGMPNIARYEHELLEYGTDRLGTVPGLTIIGTAPEKAGVLSFVLDGQRTEDVGAALDQEGIAVRSGHHCAQPILRRFGHEATVRASLAPYNTREDIDALVAALLRLQVGRPPRGI
jgi:cysteine desulfurase/selenocysteine lyase